MQCLSQGARGCLIFVPREQLLPDICFVRQVGDQYLSEQVNRCRKFVSETVVPNICFRGGWFGFQILISGDRMFAIFVSGATL